MAVGQYFGGHLRELDLEIGGVGNSEEVLGLILQALVIQLKPNSVIVDDVGVEVEVKGDVFPGIFGPQGRPGLLQVEETGEFEGVGRDLQDLQVHVEFEFLCADFLRVFQPESLDVLQQAVDLFLDLMPDFFQIFDLEEIFPENLNFFALSAQADFEGVFVGDDFLQRTALVMVQNFHPFDEGLV